MNREDLKIGDRVKFESDYGFDFYRGTIVYMDHIGLKVDLGVHNLSYDEVTSILPEKKRHDVDIIKRSRKSREEGK